MKEGLGNDNLAIAWEYPGQTLEVIPAKFSHVTLPCKADPSCGATLDTWTDISGTSISDLMVGTHNLTTVPNQSTRLTDLLEGSNNAGDSFGSRMKGLLIIPKSGDYSFWIAADDNAEFWLSTDSNSANKVRVCYTPGPVSRRNFTANSEQKSNPISLVAGQAYYYEVRYVFFSHLICSGCVISVRCLILMRYVF